LDNSKATRPTDKESFRRKWEKKDLDESNKNTSHPNSLSSLDLKLNCVKINLIWSNQLNIFKDI
jgi:hypothetical protein